MILNNLKSLFLKTNKQEIVVNDLPSQGYFYPNGLRIFIEKGDDGDKETYTNGFNNSTIFGITDTIKTILRDKVSFNTSEFEFTKIKAIDLLYIFLEFVKYTTERPVYFNTLEFCKSNFVYFDFDQFKENYSQRDRCFIFDGWRFSLPTIGIETSLSRFSYEVTMRGKSEQYENKNYNFIYFLSDLTNINYDMMINLINLYDELEDSDKETVKNIVDKFEKSGIYFLLEEGKKPTRINSNMLRTIWR